MCARCKHIFRKSFRLAIPALYAHITHMRKTKSTNLTLNDGVKEMARKLVEELHHSSMTSLVEQLIREEYERRVRKLDVSEKKDCRRCWCFSSN